jgi:hypothetical protein
VPLQLNKKTIFINTTRDKTQNTVTHISEQIPAMMAKKTLMYAQK